MFSERLETTDSVIQLFSSNFWSITKIFILKCCQIIYLKTVSQIFDKFRCYYFIEFSVVFLSFFYKKKRYFFTFLSISFQQKNLITNLRHGFLVNEFGNISVETKIFLIGKELEENNFFKVTRSVFINIVNM